MAAISIAPINGELDEFVRSVLDGNIPAAPQSPAPKADREISSRTGRSFPRIPATRKQIARINNLEENLGYLPTPADEFGSMCEASDLYDDLKAERDAK